MITSYRQQVESIAKRLKHQEHFTENRAHYAAEFLQDLIDQCSEYVSPFIPIEHKMVTPPIEFGTLTYDMSGNVLDVRKLIFEDEDLALRAAEFDIEMITPGKTETAKWVFGVEDIYGQKALLSSVLLKIPDHRGYALPLGANGINEIIVDGESPEFREQLFSDIESKISSIKDN